MAIADWMTIHNDDKGNWHRGPGNGTLEPVQELKVLVVGGISFVLHTVQHRDRRAEFMGKNNTSISKWAAG
jgi:hypothetical protein